MKGTVLTRVYNKNLIHQDIRDIKLIICTGDNTQ